MAVREGKARSGALIARGWAITTLGSLKEKLGHFFLRSGTNLISAEELPVVSRRDAGPLRQGEGHVILRGGRRCLLIIPQQPTTGLLGRGADSRHLKEDVVCIP